MVIFLLISKLRYLDVIMPANDICLIEQIKAFNLFPRRKENQTTNTVKIGFLNKIPLGFSYRLPRKN